MNVLVGFAGTDESHLALRNTLDRAEGAGDTVTVAIFSDGDRSLDELEVHVTETLAEVEIEANIERIEADHLASRLVALAETGDYDQLVIGGGVQSPMGKIELGSITEYVLLNARVTVRLER